MQVVIVGVGALGSHLMLFARNFDANFTVIDFDRVEQKNTLSQFHTRMGLNRNKAQALQQTMQGLFNVRVNSIPHRLTEDNVEALLGNADLVVDCLDNGDSRTIVQNFVRENGIECLHGALSAGGQFGSVVWDETFKIDYEDKVGQPTCEDGEHLPFIIYVSSILALKVQKFIEDGTKSSAHLMPGAMISL
jgi:molybdopterin-synthase adenylyltransferase